MATMTQMFECCPCVSVILPSGTPIFIANSMPVRGCRVFLETYNSAALIFFNRGAMVLMVIYPQFSKRLIAIKSGMLTAI